MPDRTDNRLLAVPVFVVLLILAGVLGLAMLACAITSQVPASVPPTATAQQVDVVVVPQNIVVTATMDPVLIAATLTAAVPIPTVAIVVQQEVQPVQLVVAIPAGCTVRTDWVAYTVQPGDTVGGLAIATNTALADIVIGNCLQDADLIQVGQVLYLPYAPVVTNPVVTIAPGLSLPTIGFLLVEPATIQSNAYVVSPGDVVISAQSVSNTRRVDFYMAPIGTTAPPLLLGADDNLTDGAALLWRVSTPFTANVWATATSPDNLAYSTDPILVINRG